MRWFHIFTHAVVALCAAAASAQTPVMTPSGELRVTGEMFEKRLFVGRSEIPVDEGLMGIEVAERLGDIFLIRTLTGGNACPAFFFWLETERRRLRRSESFGSCADEYELLEGHDTLTVTMSAFDATGARVAYDYDGDLLVERPVGPAESGLPPEAGGAFWAGRYPFELATAPEWRDVFVSLMGEAEYAAAQEMLSLATPMEADGDWVAGRGCRQHDCDATAAAVAVNGDGSRLLVVIRDKGATPRMYGDPGGALPREVLKVLRNPWK